MVYYHCLYAAKYKTWEDDVWDYLPLEYAWEVAVEANKVRCVWRVGYARRPRGRTRAKHSHARGL